MNTILIGGDLVPTKSNLDLFKESDIKTLIGEELTDILQSADNCVFNLEVPLTDELNPIPKLGPNLAAPTSTINGIKALNTSLLVLANNHIMDQGEKGLNSTLEILEKNGIPFVGIGDNVFNSSEPHVFKVKEKKIGIYACAETEFTIATEDSAGANPFDPFESLDHIQNLKKECDHVIVLYHGGKEHYRYPSPYLQKVCRKIIEKGADAVICQHSHCIGSFEKYKRGTIVYGQGNFIFDKADNEYWNTSLLIKFIINEELNIEYIPILKNGNRIKLAGKADTENILNEFNKRSEEILNSGYLKGQYNKLSEERLLPYLRCLAGFGIWLSRIDRIIFKGLIIKKIFSRKKMLIVQNFIECEVHRELILNGLKKRISD